VRAALLPRTPSTEPEFILLAECHLMNAIRPRSLPVAAGVAAGAVVLLATPAFAHVTVDPGEAAKGSYSTIDFKVPNERDNASTVKLQVFLPTDHPLASVMPEPVPGWHVSVTKTKLAKPVTLEGDKVTEAVSSVTWSGGKIAPGAFQEFPLSVGQLPQNADQLVFKALQTYSSKEVVRWIEVPKQGAPEPANPAPVLKLVPANAATGQGSTASTSGAQGPDADAASQAASPAASGSDDTTARVLGVAGIAVGAVGIAFGALGWRRRSA
jgi:uncharacterized protein YcnI